MREEDGGEDEEQVEGCMQHDFGVDFGSILRSRFRARESFRLRHT